MNASTRSSGRTIWVAVRATAVFTVVLGIGYTAALTGVGQFALPAQANGSLAYNNNEVVGSHLIGQPFADEEGTALAEFFQPRPSAAGDGYDGGASAGSNYGPENADLIALIGERRAAVAEANNVSEEEVPADAVTASSSGLDPHISPEYANLQVERVADARGLSTDEVRDLVSQHTAEPALGYLGERTVNVLDLNLALEAWED